MREQITLSGDDWYLGQFEPGKGESKGAHEPRCPLGDAWMRASVPGDVHSTLLEKGAIPDPHYADNFERVKWVHECEWWYRKRIHVPAEWLGRGMHLLFEGLDYVADVWADGHYLGHHEEMFNPARFDLSALVAADSPWHENTVPSSGMSPTRELMIAVRLSPAPSDRRLIGGRKCNLAYGIDYAPLLITAGIWKDVRLVATDGAYIEDVSIRTGLDWSAARNGLPHRATICVGVKVASDGSDRHPAAPSARLRLWGDGFEQGEHKVEVSCERGPDGNSWTATAQLIVEEPRLWWPWDLGHPDVYRLQVDLLDPDADGALLDRWEGKVGVREVRRGPNEGAPDGAEPWRFVVNGRPTFIRGANWTNVDALPGRLSECRYRRLLDMARDANINMLRVHGWHLMETETFYRLCDELGIMVWQEFAFCNTDYPQTEEFIEGAAEACAVALHGVRNHPSLTVVGAGNEYEYEPNRALIDRLERVCHAETPDRIWATVSDARRHARIESDYHNWEVWHEWKPVEHYSDDECVFVSEFGLQSPPSLESLRRFLPEDQLWPPGPAWEAHLAQLGKLKHYAAAYAYGDTAAADCFNSIEDFVAASQAAQAYGLKFAAEHYRRRKPACGGCMFWQFNEPWPAVVWSIVDYYLEPKAGYEAVKSAYAPLQLSLTPAKRWCRSGDRFCAQVWLVNDLYKEWRHCTASIRLISEGQSSLVWTAQTDVVADSSRQLGEVSWPVPEGVGGFLVELELRDSQDEVLTTNEYAFKVQRGGGGMG